MIKPTPKSLRLTFLGAASTVTGSRFLLEHTDSRVLVDCGLFQGYKHLRQRNWSPLAVEPSSIDAVVLTHAHIDHSGWLPVLVREGFRGPIFASRGTCALAEVLLLDSGRLQEADAEHAARHGFSRHDKPLPLYTEADARKAITRFVPIDETCNPAPGMSVQLTPAGHILGASSVSVTADGHTVVFSGDLGRSDCPLMYPPASRPSGDILLVESTYGNRTHPPVHPADEIAAIVERTYARGGTVIVPSFAVGRTQLLLLLLHRLKQQGRLPDIPIVLDSPLADTVTDLYEKYVGLHKLSAQECTAAFGSIHVSTTPEDSKALDADSAPKIIIAGSGMATGGRVVHHIKRFAPYEKNTLMFVGFQAGGTRGATITGGAESVKIHGDWVPIRCEIARLDGLSAHADANGLIAWLRSGSDQPKHTFVIHGEPDASDTLRRRIQDELGWEASVPEQGQRYSFA